MQNMDIIIQDSIEEIKSMIPEYEIGTVVITKKTDVNELKVGDVISFYSMDQDISGEVNTHRIVNIEYGGDDNAPYFTTKGDNNSEVDKHKVWPSQIVGKVVYNLGTVSGTVIGVFQNPNVIFFVIVLPLIFITFGEAVNLVSLIAESKFRKKEDDNDIPEEKN